MSFGRRSHGSAGAGDGHGDLMITPLLDLFVALIPFLIFSAVMTKINIIDVGISKPVASTVPAKESKFDLMLKVSESQVTIMLNGKSVKVTAMSSTDEAWIANLRSALVEIKKSHPEEYKLRIEPQGKVTLQTLMVIMDAARKLKPEDGEILRKDEQGKNVKLQFLFPNIVLRGVYT